VIVPTLPAALDLRGLRLFLATLQKVKSLNPNLETLGVIVSQYDGRMNAHQEALEAMHTAGLPILAPTVPRSVRVQEAAGARMALTDYDPTGKPAEAYREITGRVIEWLERNRT
jgi:chromosome partitioning protein